MELFGYDTKWIKLDFRHDQKLIEIRPLKKNSNQAYYLEQVSNDTAAKRLNNSQLIEQELSKLIDIPKDSVKRYPVDWIEKDRSLIVKLESN